MPAEQTAAAKAAREALKAANPEAAAQKKADRAARKAAKTAGDQVQPVETQDGHVLDDEQSPDSLQSGHPEQVTTPDDCLLDNQQIPYPLQAESIQQDSSDHVLGDLQIPYSLQLDLEQHPDMEQLVRYMLGVNQDSQMDETSQQQYEHGEIDQRQLDHEAEETEPLNDWTLDFPTNIGQSIVEARPAEHVGQSLCQATDQGVQVEIIDLTSEPDTTTKDSIISVDEPINPGPVCWNYATAVDEPAVVSNQQTSANADNVISEADFFYNDDLELLEDTTGNLPDCLDAFSAVIPMAALQEQDVVDLEFEALLASLQEQPQAQPKFELEPQTQAQVQVQDSLFFQPGLQESQVDTGFDISPPASDHINMFQHPSLSLPAALYNSVYPLENQGLENNQYNSSQLYNQYGLYNQHNQHNQYNQHAQLNPLNPLNHYHQFDQQNQHSHYSQYHQHNQNNHNSQYNQIDQYNHLNQFNLYNQNQQLHQVQPGVDFPSHPANLTFTAQPALVQLG
jgi:hypothetical protein